MSDVVPDQLYPRTYASLSTRGALLIRCGERRGSMESCSSSVSKSGRRVWPSIWSRGENHRRKVGRLSFAIMLIGSIRRECVDHVVVFGERHLRHVLLSYLNYYNEVRTHLSLEKDAPVSGGLHHQYVRI